MPSLGPRSVMRLKGVHPDLVKVVQHAIEITEVDFTVLEGLRTLERQRELVKAGASQTLKSRHLTGHAVDLAAWVDDQVDWSWPLYSKIAKAMKTAAADLKIPIEWGGDWLKFKDGPHFQLPFKDYP
jgi:peptidoglycan L-alanyl-D-glutamate endopeptidase CwlK